MVGYTVTFTEAVTGFVEGDLSVSGGTVSNFAGSGTTYTFDVTADDDSTTDITVDIAGGAAVDAVGNTSTAATQSVQAVDTVNPTVSIADDQVGTASDSDPVVGYTITFSESVTGFVEGDLVVAGGTVSNFAGSGTTYTFDVTADDDSTTDITVDIGAGAAQDAVGNDSEAAVQATQAVDTVNPTVSIADDRQQSRQSG